MKCSLIAVPLSSFYCYHDILFHELKDQKMLNISNTLTAMRLALVVPIVAFYLMSFPYHQIMAALLFAIASFIDWADGYIARKRNEESSLGAAFDHIADKILIASVLIAITYHAQSITLALCTILIISRELFISGLREHMSGIGKRDLVKVSWLGKIKTALQMATVLLILVSEPAGLTILVGEVLMSFVVAFTLISAWYYLPNAKNL